MEKEQKKTKFRKCTKCGANTVLAICVCGKSLQEIKIKKYGDKTADKSDK